MSVVCCQVEVSATSWSLVQRSYTDCGASLCDLENLVSEEGEGLLRKNPKTKTKKAKTNRDMRSTDIEASEYAVLFSLLLPRSSKGQVPSSMPHFVF